MDLQLAFNLVVGIAAFLCGYVLNSINKRIESLQAADVILTDKLHKIETLVVGEYVKHSDLDKSMDKLSGQIFLHMNAINTTLVKIEEKLDGKQDRL